MGWVSHCCVERLQGQVLFLHYIWIHQSNKLLLVLCQQIGSYLGLGRKFLSKLLKFKLPDDRWHVMLLHVVCYSICFKMHFFSTFYGALLPGLRHGVERGREWVLGDSHGPWVIALGHDSDFVVAHVCGYDETFGHVLRGDAPWRQDTLLVVGLLWWEPLGFIPDILLFIVKCSHGEVCDRWADDHRQGFLEYWVPAHIRFGQDRLETLNRFLERHVGRWEELCGLAVARWLVRICCGLEQVFVIIDCSQESELLRQVGDLVPSRAIQLIRLVVITSRVCRIQHSTDFVPVFYVKGHLGDQFRCVGRDHSDMVLLWNISDGFTFGTCLNQNFVLIISQISDAVPWCDRGVTLRIESSTPCHFTLFHLGSSISKWDTFFYGMLLWDGHSDSWLLWRVWRQLCRRALCDHGLSFGLGKIGFWGLYLLDYKHRICWALLPVQERIQCLLCWSFLRFRRCGLFIWWDLFIGGQSVAMIQIQSFRRDQSLTFIDPQGHFGCEAVCTGHYDRLLDIVQVGHFVACNLNLHTHYILKLVDPLYVGISHALAVRKPLRRRGWVFTLNLLLNRFDRLKLLGSGVTTFHFYFYLKLI